VLVNNTWGFTLLSPSDSLPVWVAVPKFGSALQIKATSSTAELDPGDQTTVQYGAKVDFSQPGGRYSAVVVFTVVGI
jgi:hypothetical protein